MEQNFWSPCSTCKKPIPFSSNYQECSVSTCQSGRLSLHFCSIPCWDAHLGFARHRESTAIEMKAPSREEYEASLIKPEIKAPRRIIVSSPSSHTPSNDEYTGDTLVVVSKVKQYIREQSEYNTSQCCIEALTQKVAEECRKAIENARAAGRKTVMGRDVE